MDFAKFYNEQPDYAAFRNDDLKREEYNVTVDWKARKLCHLIPDGFVINSIMEVGCAIGILLNNISDRLSVKIRTGIDISSENIKVAERLFPGCNFFTGTIEDYTGVFHEELHNKRVDLIILSDIVEHLPADMEFMKKISEISSYVLMNLPLEKCFRNRNRQYGESDPSGHLRSYDRELALRLVTLAGFEVVKSEYAVASSDRLFFEMYKRNRKVRLKSKPAPLRLFWTSFYAAEDLIKRSDSKVNERIYGTNYFALLKSINK